MQERHRAEREAEKSTARQMLDRAVKAALEEGQVLWSTELEQRKHDRGVSVKYLARCGDGSLLLIDGFSRARWGKL